MGGQSGSSDLVFKDIRNEVHRELMEQVDLSREVGDDELVHLLEEIITRKSRSLYISIADKLKLRRDIFNSVRKFDLLQELLEDADVTEIMVNGTNNIFIEKNGRLYEWGGCFESEKSLEDVAQRIVAGANRAVNESNPIVDARLPCGSRVNVCLPPIALNGPIITIRKFPTETMTMQKLIEFGSISAEAAVFMKQLVQAGYNIFVSGGTGTGKTTFLNCLSNYIPETERIITIEDSAELQIKGVPNLVRLEVRNANTEGNNAVSIRDLIKASLRMRPDRIIVGEVRDAASIDMLQALNTGHSGMSTGHSNSAADMLSRLETMVLLGADIPLAAIRGQIASAIDIIVHLGRLRDKSRHVLEIVEILGYHAGEIQTEVLYRFEEEGEDAEGKIIGSLKKTGKELTSTGKLASAGLLPADYIRAAVDNQ